uniref:RxLR effector protein n=1 Tax=Phytophthora ramorum TaxID=164328 RepID=H3H4M6_PHYRM
MRLHWIVALALVAAHDENGEERAVSVSGLAGAIKSKTSAIKESAKLNLWLTTRKSAPQVFKLLKIDDTINDVLANPKMNVLAKYISMYNKKNPNNQVSMVDLLSARYGGEAAVARMFVKAKQSEATTSLATKLQAEQVAGWLKNDKSTDDVFKILLLDDANANPLGTRRLTAWLNYMSEFNRLNPEKKTTMLQTFTTAYGGDK